MADLNFRFSSLLLDELNPLIMSTGGYLKMEISTDTMNFCAKINDK